MFDALWPMLDIACRGGTVVLLLLLGASLLRDHGGSLAARVGAVFASGVAAYAVCSAPGVAELRVWWHAPLLAVASGNAVVFWLFARALFDDGFVARPWHAAIWLGFALAALADFFLLAPVVGVRPLGIALALGRVGFAAQRMVGAGQAEAGQQVDADAVVDAVARPVPDHVVVEIAGDDCRPLGQEVAVLAERPAQRA